jgi:hypothetical protein
MLIRNCVVVMKYRQLRDLMEMTFFLEASLVIVNLCQSFCHQFVRMCLPCVLFSSVLVLFLFLEHDDVYGWSLTILLD